MSDNTSTALRYWLSILTEHLFLGIGLALLIPPPVSIDGQVYSGWYRGLVLMWVFVALSRFLAFRRNQETLVGAILKLAIFSALGISLHEVSTMW